jgi:8-oxo-dGTP pyrophosphatase MutT (NUDIX family)
MNLVGNRASMTCQFFLIPAQGRAAAARNEAAGETTAATRALEKMSSARKKAPAKRVQYAALPYRRRSDDRTQVMLVTARESGRWVIPKGWPKKKKTPADTAACEALEEAGVVGKVGRSSIGSYSIKKRLKSGAVVSCVVRVFPLKVKRQQKSWPERGERDIQWFSRAKAAKIVRERALADIIRNLPKGR